MTWKLCWLNDVNAGFKVYVYKIESVIIMMYSIKNSKKVLLSAVKKWRRLKCEITF